MHFIKVYCYKDFETKVCTVVFIRMEKCLKNSFSVFQLFRYFENLSYNMYGYNSLQFSMIVIIYDDFSYFCRLPKFINFVQFFRTNLTILEQNNKNFYIS